MRRVILGILLMTIAGCQSNPQVAVLQYEVRSLQEEVVVLKSQLAATKRTAVKAQTKTVKIQREVEEVKSTGNSIVPSAAGDEPSIVKPRQINHEVKILQ